MLCVRGFHMHNRPDNCTKIAALDIGDQWVGVALSDRLRIVATPYTTVAADTLEQFLTQLFTNEPIDLIIVGYPKTLRGTESQQTHKTVALTQKLQERFHDKKFILWDERLSSKRAQAVQKFGQKSGAYKKDKAEKLKSHARAAAFILDSYLIYLSAQH
jgi:putative holliday junction resolvase